MFCHPPGFEVGGVKRFDGVASKMFCFTLFIEDGIPHTFWMFAEIGIVFVKTGFEGYCRMIVCKHSGMTEGI